MKKSFKLLILVSAILLLCACAFADGDTFPTIGMGETEVQVYGGSDVNYLFTAPSDGFYTFASHCEDYSKDPRLDLYTLNGDWLDESDDNNGFRDFTLTYALSEGNSVRLKIGSYSGAITVPMTVTRVDAVDGDALTTGVNAITVPANKAVKCGFSVEDDGWFSFICQNYNGSGMEIQLNDANGAKLNSGSYGATDAVELLGNETYTLWLLPELNDADMSFDLDISQYKGKLETQITAVGGIEVENNDYVDFEAGQTYTIAIDNGDQLPENTVEIWQYKNDNSCAYSNNTYQPGSACSFTVAQDVRQIQITVNSNLLGWIGNSDSINLFVGEAYDDFRSIKINGQAYTENMAVRSLEETVFEWNYIQGANGYYLYYSADPDFEDVYGGELYSTNYESRRFSDNAGTIYAYIEAYNGWEPITRSEVMVLNVEPYSVEPAFELTASAEEALIGQDVDFTMENAAKLYAFEEYDIILRSRGWNSDETGWTDCVDWYETQDDGTTLTYVAIDENGGISNRVNVDWIVLGELPKATIAIGDKILPKTGSGKIALQPGESYTMRAFVEDEVEGLEYEISLSFYDEDLSWIRETMPVSETELTFEIPEEAAKLVINVELSAVGWGSSYTHKDIVCGEASDRFEDVRINGEPYQEGMTINAFMETTFAWNNIFDVDEYEIEFCVSPEFEDYEWGDSTSYLNDNFRFTDNFDTVYVRITARNTDWDVVGRSQVMRLGIDAGEPAFELNADAAEAIIGEEVRFTADRAFTLYNYEDSDIALWYDEWDGPWTVKYGSSYKPGITRYVAVDTDENRSNVIDVTFTSLGKLPDPDVYLDDVRLYDNGSSDQMLTPGETYTLTASMDTELELEEFYAYIYFYSEDDYKYDEVYWSGKTDQTYELKIPRNAESVEIEIHAYTNEQGYESVDFYWSCPCGYTSAGFDDIRINGIPVTGTCMLPCLKNTVLSYNAVTGAASYGFVYGDDMEWTREGNEYREFEGITAALPTSLECTLAAYDENGERIAESEPFRLQFYADEPDFALTASSAEVSTGEKVSLVSEEIGRLYKCLYYENDILQCDYVDWERMREFEVSEEYAETVYYWVETNDGRVSNRVKVEYVSDRQLETPTLLINGTAAALAKLEPGDAVHFTLNEVESAEQYVLSYYYRNDNKWSRTYYLRGLEAINSTEIIIPDGYDGIYIMVEVSAIGYDTSGCYADIPLSDGGRLTNVKVNGVPADEASVTRYEFNTITWDPVENTDYIEIGVNNLYHTEAPFVVGDSAQVAFADATDVVTIRVYTRDGQEFIYTLDVQVNEAAPAFNLSLSKENANGKTNDEMGFTVSGAQGEVHLLSVSPVGYLAYIQEMSVKFLTPGVRRVWAVDETGKASNVITLNLTQSEEPLAPVSNLALGGSLKAGDTATISFDELDEAYSYRVTVTATDKNGVSFQILDRRVYSPMDGYPIHIPLSAASVTCRVEASGQTDPSETSVTKAVSAADYIAFELPSSLTRIEEEAFAGIGAKVIRVPDGCTTIGARAFAGSALEEILLPASVRSIASDAFEGCTGLYIYNMPD